MDPYLLTEAAREAEYLEQERAEWALEALREALMLEAALGVVQDAPEAPESPEDVSDIPF